MSRDPFRLDSPLLVQWEYASEERVDRRDAEGTLVFPDPKTLREYVAAGITRAHLAENVPDFQGPLEPRSAHVVFVADK